MFTFPHRLRETADSQRSQLSFIHKPLESFGDLCSMEAANSTINRSTMATISICFCSVAILVHCGSWALAAAFLPARQFREGDLTRVLIMFAVWLMPYFANILAVIKASCHVRLSSLLLLTTSLACGGRLLFFLCVVLIAFSDQRGEGATFAGLVEFCILCTQMVVSVLFFLIACFLQKSFRIRPPLSTAMR